MLAEQPVESFEDVVVDLGIGEVEHLLPLRSRRHPLPRSKHPLGVLSRQPRVDADHFGLDPDPEVHAEVVHPIDDRVEPVRPDVRVNVPVAEGASVVAATEEPSVIEHEKLGADRCSELGELGEFRVVVVEVDRFPRVDDHATGRVRMPIAVAQEGVEPLGELVETLAACAA